MDVEEPPKISFWESHQSGPNSFEDIEKIKAINYWLAIAVAALATVVFVAGAALHWSEVVITEAGEKQIRPSGYGFFLLAAGSAVMGFYMGKIWKRPYLALPLICILGIPSVLFGNWYAEQIFEGRFIYPFIWRLFQDLCLGPFIASIASLVSLSMYRFD